MVKPLLGFSQYVLGWAVDIGSSAAWHGSSPASQCSPAPSATLAIRQSPLLCRVAGPGAAAVLLFIMAPTCSGRPEFVTFAGWGTEMMQAIDPMILTLILLVPLGGAVLVALMPDRAKLPNWTRPPYHSRQLPASRCICPRTSIPASPAFNLKSSSPGLRAPPSFTTSGWMASVSGSSFWLACSHRSASSPAGTQSNSAEKFSISSSSCSRPRCSVFSFRWT